MTPHDDTFKTGRDRISGIVKIQCSDAWGTGALVDRNLVLTALHVVRQGKIGQWGLNRSRIQCDFGKGVVLDVEIIEAAVDPHNDIAFLRCVSPVKIPTTIHPLRCANIEQAANFHRGQTAWRTFAFPEHRDTGTFLSGNILGLVPPPNEYHRTQLEIYCQDAQQLKQDSERLYGEVRNNKDLHGASGAPCLVAHGNELLVVGVIVQHSAQLAAGKLYCAPIECILEKFPREDVQLHASVPVPEDVNCIAWSQHDILAIGTSTEIRLVDMRRMDLDVWIIKTNCNVYALRFSPDGLTLAAQCATDMYIWPVSLPWGANIQGTKCNTANEFTQKLDCAGSWFVTGSANGGIAWHDATNRQRRDMQTHFAAFRIIALVGVSDGSVWSVDSASNGRKLGYSRLDESKHAWVLAGERGRFVVVAVTSAGVFGVGQLHVYRFDPDAQDQPSWPLDRSLQNKSWVEAIGMGPGKCLLRTEDNALYLGTFSSDPAKTPVIERRSMQAEAIAASPDGRYVARVWQGRVHVHEAREFKEVRANGIAVGQ